jgi:hypothetical protein
MALRVQAVPARLALLGQRVRAALPVRRRLVRPVVPPVRPERLLLERLPADQGDLQWRLDKVSLALAT